MKTRDFIPSSLPLGAFEPVDRALAAFVERAAGAPDKPLALAAALTSRALREGHACLDLAVWAGRPVGREGEDVAPSLGPWREALQAAKGAVGAPGSWRPLTLAPRDRVYLTRVWREELAIARRVRALACAPGKAVSAEPRAPAGTEPDWQFAAVWVALRRRLAVITGGPGSGKTRTIGALVQELIRHGADPLQIAVAAPTGKAVARLQEALGAARAAAGGFGGRVLTLHKLLGASASGDRFRYGPGRPVAAEIVIVDEASMVDMSLMHRLLEALPPSARLVLVGDKDQLPAVDAGNVLGDLCPPDEVNAFPPEEAAALAAAAGTPFPAAPGPVGVLGGAVVELRRNYRFSAESGIRRASSLVRAGDAKGLADLLRDGATADGTVVLRTTPPPADIEAALAADALGEAALPGRAASPAEALAALGRFRILGATHEGPWGIKSLNAAVSGLLFEGRGRLARPNWPAGRQIVITANDYSLKLSNGDLGVAWAGATGGVDVWFTGADGAPRPLPPSRLPAHQDAWALTVHKAQGSEFDTVLLVLPRAGAGRAAERFWSGPGRLLTRELLYTGLTRARRRVILWADPEVLAAAVEHRSERASGLREALQNGAP